MSTAIKLWTTSALIVSLLNQTNGDFVDDIGSLSGISSHLAFDEFRSIDGTGNNQMDNDMGAAHTATQKCVPSAYADGYNSMAGQYRYNPRELSNVLSVQDPEESKAWVNDRYLTQFAWQFGQFIDHDITLVTEDKSVLDPYSHIDIYMPCNDPTFDPYGHCDAAHVMPMCRSKAYNGSGEHDTRYQQNDITSFVDASMIYGSDQEVADSLRSYQDGLMNVTETNHGDLLPIGDDGFFIGGDIRANEVTGLTMLHTIFIRLHNMIARSIIDTVELNHPGLDNAQIDELVYQYAKVIVNAIIQKIAYKDWLPTLFGPTATAEYLGTYAGYDSNVTSAICNIFSSAVFRFGHSMIPQKLPLRNDKCNQKAYSNDDLELRESFFEPTIWSEKKDLIECMVNGFSCTLSNEVDLAVTDALRNFLFHNLQPEEEAVGLDLMAVNIQRGRDHGLPDYNSVREYLGLDPIADFDGISDDEALNRKLKVLYKNDVDSIDLFVGVLAEQHFEDGSFGELISLVVLEQFARLRDGDRFWYEHYVVDGELRDIIDGITLKDVMEATTNIDEVQLDESGNMFQNENAKSIFDKAGTAGFNHWHIYKAYMDWMSRSVRKDRY
eukprot:147829_1